MNSTAPMHTSLKSHTPMAIMQAIYGRCRHDAVIAFGSRRKGKDKEEAPRFLIPVQASEMDRLLPHVFEYFISQTQYLMPNTLGRGALGKKDATNYEQALLDHKPPIYFEAKNKHVMELCAITVDLDVGREGDMPAGMALGMVMDLCESEEMPWPSLAAFSGRGAYLLWLLRSENGAAPPLNTPENRHHWLLCVNALVAKCHDLKSDSNAKRVANWFKRPGTMDTKTGKEVVYMTFGIGDLTRIPFYKLPDLADALGVFHAPIVKKPSGELSIPPLPFPKHRPGGRSGRVRKVRPGKGGEALRLRMQEIERLSEFRKGFTKGCRHKVLFHYFQACQRYLKMLYRNHVAGSSRATGEAKDRSLCLNQQFRPPMSQVEFKNAIKVKLSGRVARGETIAADLGVTKLEVTGLNLRQIVPEPTKRKMQREDREKIVERKTINGLRRKAVDADISAGRQNTEIIARLGSQFVISHSYISKRRCSVLKSLP